MPDWILRTNRALQCGRLASYRTRIGRIQYRINAFTYVCILFWKIMLNRSLVVILRPIYGLLKQFINNNRSKFVISKLVLTGVCCKQFMYTCMYRSCTPSCVHVECMCTYFVNRLLFNVQNTDNILLKYECKFFLFS